MMLARARAQAVLGALVPCALVVVRLALIKDKQAQGTAGKAVTCNKDWVPVDARLPDTKEVKINVYNASGHDGLATQAAARLSGGGFKIGKVDADPRGKPLDGVVELRFGPKTVGAQWLLKAYFLNADSQFDLKRQDDTVDVVLGRQYQAINSVTEVNQALGSLGKPIPPPATCPTNA